MNIPNLAWPIVADGVQLIATAEQGPGGGPALRAYLCPAGVWTIGLGETEGIRQGMVCTESQAWDWLCRDLTIRAAAVVAMCDETPEPNELAALVSLGYNIGLEALRRSTVMRAHRAGDAAAASRAFAMWNKAKVKGVLKPLPGLTSRRASEAALYLRPEPDAWRQPMPQAVASEPRMLASRTVQSSTATVAIGALAGLSQFKDQFAPVGEVFAWGRGLLTDIVGVPTGWVFPVLVMSMGAVVLWRRFKQRADGTA